MIEKQSRVGYFAFGRLASLSVVPIHKGESLPTSAKPVKFVFFFFFCYQIENVKELDSLWDPFYLYRWEN